MNDLDVIVDWWTERLMVMEKRAAFRLALIPLVETLLATGRTFYLRVDYDPEHELLAAVRAAGIECNGFMWSAQGILPMKTSMRIAGDVIEASEGRGSPYQVLARRGAPPAAPEGSADALHGRVVELEPGVKGKKR